MNVLGLRLREVDEGIVTADRPCRRCGSTFVGVDGETDRILFGCLRCGGQWAAPASEPHGLIPGSDWTFRLDRPKVHVAARRGA